MLYMHNPFARVCSSSASEAASSVRHSRPYGVACCLVYSEAQAPLQIQHAGFGASFAVLAGFETWQMYSAIDKMGITVQPALSTG